RILTASWDKTCRIWDVETGQQLSQIAGNPAAVEAAEFSPDGRRILTVSSGMNRDATYEDDPRRGNPPQKVDAPLSGPQPQARVLEVRGGGTYHGYRSLSINKVTLKLPLLGEMNFKPPARPGVRLWDAHTGKAIVGGSGADRGPADSDTACAAFTEDG